MTDNQKMRLLIVGEGVSVIMLALIIANTFIMTYLRMEAVVLVLVLLIIRQIDIIKRLTIKQKKASVYTTPNAQHFSESYVNTIALIVFAIAVFIESIMFVFIYLIAATFDILWVHILGGIVSVYYLYGISMKMLNFSEEIASNTLSQKELTGKVTIRQVLLILMNFVSMGVLAKYLFMYLH